MNIKDLKIDEQAYSTLLANISQAFAYKKSVRKEVDKLYDKFKSSAYKKAKESIAYNNEIITYGSLEDEIYRKKALGLILLGEENEIVSKKLISMIKRNFGELYSVVKSKREKALYEYVANIAINIKIIDPSYRKTIEYLLAYLIIKNSEPNSLPESHQKFLDILIETVKNMDEHSAIKIDIKKAIKDNRQKIDSILNRIQNNKGSYSCYDDIFYTKDEEIKKYETMISMLFDFEKMSISNLLNSVKLNEQDIDEIILTYTLLYGDSNLERTTNLLINGIIIKSLLKAYKAVKEMYFMNNKETLYLDFEALENKIKDLESKYRICSETLESLRSKLNRIDAEKEKEINKIENKYKQEISLLNRKIKKLENELENERKNKRELIELREIIFKIENDKNIDYFSCNLEELIGDKKIMVVGGTPEWRRRLKEKYSQILTLDGFAENLDTRIFDSVDYVFFYVGYMNHATYYKIVNVLKNKNIPFKYIGKTNIELVEKEIADELNKLVKMR